MKKLIAFIGFASALVPPASALAQADTVTPPRALFTRNDAVLAGVFTIGAFAARPLDKYFAQRLQSPRVQEHLFLRRSSRIVEGIAVPGAFFIGGGMYLAGRLSKEHKLADLGLHGSEALLIGEMLGGVMKGTFGRARPYLTPDDPNPDDWQLLRGFRGNDAYRSFPSGHTVAAFAAGAAVTAEMSRWKPDSRWAVGTVMYGGAGLVGLSRMYNNRHWASDVIMGAAIGTFAGTKVVRYHRTHPGNGFDKFMLNASWNPGDGTIAFSILPDLRKSHR